MKVPWGNGNWQRVLIYGLGLSGKAALRLLRGKGLSIVAVDRRPREHLELGALEGDAQIEWLLGQEPDALPPGVDGVVVSPGVPPERPLLQAAQRVGVPVVGEVELAFPFIDGTVLAITGSNGKSTTTALTGALLESFGRRVEVCGNIGAPVSSRVDGPQERIFVVELSSFQLERLVTFKAHAAAFLNLSPDHLDRYADLESYGAAKAEIFARQDHGGVAIFNADEPEVAAMARGAMRARQRFFSRRHRVEDGCYLDDERVVAVSPEEKPIELFRTSDVPLEGVHNLENAMAAALLALSVDVDPRGLRSGLLQFQGLPHRLHKVLEREGVRWYDDSKGTNMAATVKSLEGFPAGSVHLILGGRNKGADPALLADAVREKVRRLYFIGEAAPEFEEALGDLVASETAGTVECAVERVARLARPGEVVLLSPACASFDQFQDYVERGEHFQRLVRDLVGGNDG